MISYICPHLADHCSSAILFLPVLVFFPSASIFSFCSRFCSTTGVALILMHHLDNQLTYNFQINHTIHVNILFTHTLTSTSHHQSSNDLYYTLGLIVTPCPQISYNQAMQWPCSYTNISQVKPLEHEIWLPHDCNQAYHSIQAMIYYNHIPIVAKIWTQIIKQPKL